MNKINISMLAIHAQKRSKEKKDGEKEKNDGKEIKSHLLPN